MFSWKFLLRFFIWLQIWKLAGYAGTIGNPSLLAIASGIAFGLTVWPYPANKPQTNNGGHG
jgi:hypothetical protein